MVDRERVVSWIIQRSVHAAWLAAPYVGRGRVCRVGTLWFTILMRVMQIRDVRVSLR